jgi:Proteasome-substrate-size regulator, mid region
MVLLRSVYSSWSSSPAIERLLWQLLKHKNKILELLNLLINKTKSERGYSSTGRLLTRITHALSAVYPLNNRFVNTDEWDSAGN